MQPQRPWPTGFGWIVALVVLIVAVLSLFVATTVPHLVTILIIGLAIALLVG